VGGRAGSSMGPEASSVRRLGEAATTTIDTSNKTHEMPEAFSAFVRIPSELCSTTEASIVLQDTPCGDTPVKQNHTALQALTQDANRRGRGRPRKETTVRPRAVAGRGVGRPRKKARGVGGPGGHDMAKGVAGEAALEGVGGVRTTLQQMLPSMQELGLSLAHSPAGGYQNNARPLQPGSGKRKQQVQHRATTSPKMSKFMKDPLGERPPASNDSGAFQTRMKEILNDGAIKYIGAQLKDAMLQVLPTRSVFGYRSIRIHKRLYFDRFETKYSRKQKEQSNEAHLLHEPADLLENSLEGLGASISEKRLRMVTFSRDDFQEMMGACGYFGPHSARLEADDPLIEYTYDPLFALQRQYRFRSTFEDLIVTSDAGRKTKCPQVLSEVIARLRAQIALSQRHSSKTSTLWQERANIKFLSRDTIIERIKTPQEFFFPLEKLEYNEHPDGITNLFTLFEETEGKEILEHQTSQKGMKMSEPFLIRMPQYYQWLVDFGIHSVEI